MTMTYSAIRVGYVDVRTSSGLPSERIYDNPYDAWLATEQRMGFSIRQDDFFRGWHALEDWLRYRPVDQPYPTFGPTVYAPPRSMVAECPRHIEGCHAHDHLADGRCRSIGCPCRIPESVDPQTLSHSPDETPHVHPARYLAAQGRRSRAAAATHPSRTDPSAA
jgi:hypothetical protein